MSTSGLAARCTACGTVFRVVPDQLRVSEGWVRCGRCAEVFNASENLVDIETGAARPTPQDWPQPGRPEVQDAQEPRTAAAGQTLAPPSPPALPSTPPAEEGALDPGAMAPAELSITPRQPAIVPTPAEAMAEPETLPAAAAPQASPATPKPSFLRQAERAQRWRQPRVRAALGVLALLGLLGLTAQVLHTWRDRVAAHFPATRPLLEELCHGLGCTLPAVREIHSLTVESSGLVRVERSSLYKLQAVLRNRADIELALPALELSLTDAQGRLAVRKVLYAEQLGALDHTVAARSELNLQATLQVLAPTARDVAPSARADDARGSTPVIAGYTIELFYP